MIDRSFNEVIAAALTGLIAHFAGLNWEIILIWLALAGIDIITGVLKSLKKGSFFSAGMNKLYRKAAEFFLMFALILVQIVAMQVGIKVPVAPIFIAAFSFKEFGSIIENCIEMGVDVPELVKKWFKVANATINDEKGK